MILYQHFFFTAKIMENRNKTIVVKFGTSTLTQGSPKLNRPHMIDIVRQLALLHQAGFRLVIRNYHRLLHQNSYWRQWGKVS